jgi:hypothetical protein
MCRARPLQWAFPLIELLVIIVIIGVQIGLPLAAHESPQGGQAHRL